MTTIYRSTPVSKKKVPAEIDTASRQPGRTRTSFSCNGSERDDGVKRLGAEAKAIEAVRETVLQAQEETHRVRVKFGKTRIYLERD